MEIIEMPNFKDWVKLSIIFCYICREFLTDYLCGNRTLVIMRLRPRYWEV